MYGVCDITDESACFNREKLDFTYQRYLRIQQKISQKHHNAMKSCPRIESQRNTAVRYRTYSIAEMWQRKNMLPKLGQAWYPEKMWLDTQNFFFFLFTLWCKHDSNKHIATRATPKIYNSEGSCMPTSHHWETLPICSLVFVKPSTLGSHLFSLHLIFFPHNKYFLPRKENLKQTQQTNLMK